MSWVPNREALAWAAGFFDGEGYIGALRDKRGWTGVTVHVVQACTQPIESDSQPPVALKRFQEAVGIAGNWSSRGPSRPGGKHRWDFRVSRIEDVQHVVAVLWEWLGPVKREQARQALLKQRSSNRPWPRMTCKNGHPFDEENTRRRARPNGRFVRECRACSRAKQAAHRQRKVAARGTEGVV